mmetsp:Transcript_30555/g.56045  ORF Transcript_30555/g.56045 Transcript_30555/m.56045 type:complete len:87 (-) Transcript_30555:193-453(-)
MKVPKWREDAMRRSRNRKDGPLDSTLVGGGKRRKRKGEDVSTAAADAEKKGEGKGRKKILSRKKRFENICHELYQKSLSEEQNQPA